MLGIGANVDWKKNTEGEGKGDTPLLAACRRGHENTVGTKTPRLNELINH